MKAIRKIVDNNKGLVAFMLVLFFLTAGLAKGSLSKVSSHTAKEKDQSSLKYVLCAENGKESSLSFLDQLKDADGNDSEFAFFRNFISPGVFIAQNSSARFAEVNLCEDAATVPLYDLYCNWKLAVS